VATLLQEFKQGCRTLKEQLLGLAVPLVTAGGDRVDAAYIAQYWPGGELNQRKDLKGWSYCYGNLISLTRLVERKRDTPEDRASKRAAVLEAIAETPEVVELAKRDDEGNQTTLTVYQKSDVALRVIHGLNVYLASLVDDYHVLTRHGTQDDVELVTRLLAEQSYTQRVIVWIATTKGPGLPFGEEEQRPEVPEHLTSLHPLDFYTLAQAFQRVNVAGFAALESSTTPTSRPDWSVFWSGLEFELKTPVPALRRDRGLLSLVATAAEQARGRREAYEQAERESKKKRAG
jgi:hypothetical protein